MIPALALILLAAPAELPQAAPDAAGASHALRGALTVFVFMSVECPISNRSIPNLNELAQKYAGKVRFFGVNPEADVTAAQVAQHDKDFALGFVTLLDPKQSLAKALGAETTPTAVLVDANGAVLYRGRIDDQVVDFGKSRPKAKREDLREALDEALAGKAVSVPRTPSVGCAIVGAHR